MIFNFFEIKNQMSRQTKSDNEYENFNDTSIEVVNTSDWIDSEWFPEETEVETYPTCRVYFDELCEKTQRYLTGRWLSLNDLYSMFGYEDTRADISNAVGRLDKEGKVLFFQDKFSVKTEKKRVN